MSPNSKDAGQPRHFPNFLWAPGCQDAYKRLRIHRRRHPHPARSAALIEAIVPEGRLAAAEDMISFRFSQFTPRGPQEDSTCRHRVDPLTNRSTSGRQGVFAASPTWSVDRRRGARYFVNNVKHASIIPKRAECVIGNRRLPAFAQAAIFRPLSLSGHRREHSPPHLSLSFLPESRGWSPPTVAGRSTRNTN